MSSGPLVAPVAVAVVAAPWGPLLLATSDRGVIRLETLAIRDAFEERLVAAGHGPLLDPAADGSPAARLAARAATAVEAYLAGDPAELERLPLDLAAVRRPFDRAVLEGVRAIPFGRATSYGRLARRIGRPGAARAVGGAVGRNPVGLLVPCHRVVAGDGSLGGYGGDPWGGREIALDIKRRLLAIEGVTLPVPPGRLLDEREVSAA